MAVTQAGLLSLSTKTLRADEAESEVLESLENIPSPFCRWDAWFGLEVKFRKTNIFPFLLSFTPKESWELLTLFRKDFSDWINPMGSRGSNEQDLPAELSTLIREVVRRWDRVKGKNSQVLLYWNNGFVGVAFFLPQTRQP